MRLTGRIKHALLAACSSERANIDSDSESYTKRHSEALSDAHDWVLSLLTRRELAEMREGTKTEKYPTHSTEEDRKKKLTAAD